MMVDDNLRSDAPNPPRAEVMADAPRRSNPLIWLLLVLALLAAGWWFFQQQQRATTPATASEWPAVSETPATPDADTPANAAVEPQQAAAQNQAPVTAQEPQATAQNARRTAAAKPKPKPKTKPAIYRSAEPIARLQPEYPREALRARVEGSVVLSVDVDAAGNPANVGFVKRSTSRELDRAAVDAVRKWKFKPAISKGKPVASTVQVPIDFKLEQ